MTPKRVMPEVGELQILASTPPRANPIVTGTAKSTSP